MDKEVDSSPNEEKKVFETLTDIDVNLQSNAGESDSSKNSELPNPAQMIKELEAVYEVQVQVSAVLGKANMPVKQLLKLGRGAVVELDRRVGEAIDIYVNNRLVARGEIVVVNERLGITMTEIIKTNIG